MVGSMNRIAFFFEDKLTWANRSNKESSIAAVTKSIARRTGRDVTVWYDHAATLDRGDGHDVYQVKWYDDSTETFQERSAVI